MVLIKEYREKPKFRLSDECVECEPTYNHFDTADTIEEAIEKGNKYMEEDIVEYGMHISLIK